MFGSPYSWRPDASLHGLNARAPDARVSQAESFSYEPRMTAVLSKNIFTTFVC
jgi:hypothetical protein